MNKTERKIIHKTVIIVLGSIIAILLLGYLFGPGITYYFIVEITCEENNDIPEEYPFYDVQVPNDYVPGEFKDISYQLPSTMMLDLSRCSQEEAFYYGDDGSFKIEVCKDYLIPLENESDYISSKDWERFLSKKGLKLPVTNYELENMLYGFTSKDFCVWEKQASIYLNLAKRKDDLCIVATRTYSTEKYEGYVHVRNGGMDEHLEDYHQQWEVDLKKKGCDDETIKITINSDSIETVKSIIESIE